MQFKFRESFIIQYEGVNFIYLLILFFHFTDFNNIKQILGHGRTQLDTYCELKNATSLYKINEERKENTKII